MNRTSLLPQQDRIFTIDVIRGLAVLGILIMNIQSFSMISAAYLNPMAYGDMTGINKFIWIASHIVADQKFLSIFSMLFGIGILLFCDSVEKKGYRPSRFYYRRLFWLFTFGLIHGYLFWHGDILVNYAICGAIAFLFRKVNPLVLLSLGLILFFVPVFNFWLFGMSMEMWPPEAIENLNQSWKPGRVEIARELAALSGSVFDQLGWRIPETFKMETFIFVILLGWRTLSMMLIGMALFKFGFFAVHVPRRQLVYVLAGCLLLGLALIIQGLLKNFGSNWSAEYSMFFGSLWNYVGSMFVAVAYVSLALLASKVYKMRLMGNVGKMAFTNYLLSTVICTFIFYGHGLGMIGKVERWEQVLIVLAIWGFLIAFSWFWLKKFYFGPTEWLWRYLTYGNRPDFKRN